MQTKKRTKPKPFWITAIEGFDLTLHRTIDMKIDGYHVTFQNQVLKRKIVITWYVDGKWKGEYLQIGSLIGSKFGMPKYFTIPKKYLEIERRMNGKKASDKMKALHGKKLVGYLNYWTSPASLIRHLKKTCTEFVVIENP